MSNTLRGASVKGMKLMIFLFSQMPGSPRKSGRLVLKRDRDAPAPDPVPPIAQKQRLTESERSKIYRKKIKEDPEKENVYAEKNRQRCQSYRDQMSEETRRLYNAKGTERKKAWRQRKKEEMEQLPQKRTTRTDAAAVIAQREKWKMAKRKSRENMHWKTRETINSERRAAYHAKKMKPVPATSATSLSQPQPISLLDAPLQDDRTPEAQRKALQRAREALPESPRKFAATVSKLVDKATPRKKHELRQCGLGVSGDREIGRRFIEAVKRLKGKNMTAARNARKVLLTVVADSKCSTADIALLLNMSKKTYTSTMFSNKNKLLSKAKEEKKEEKEATVTFFGNKAVPAPDKKLVSKKTGEAALFLKRSLKELHTDFLAEGNTMPFSSFAKCRPKNVRLMAQAQLRQCLCEYCTNTALKLQTVRAVAIATGHGDCSIASERDAVRLITCNPKDKDCCYGVCNNCSVNHLDHQLAPLLHYPDQVKWYKWESRIRVARGKQVSRKMLVTKVGNFATLLTELKDEVQFLAQHLFRADWQWAQFLSMKNLDPFPRDTVLMVMDFAENFTCNYQDEVQAAHWAHDQVTVHPTVTYYRCPACLLRTTESLIFISGDTKHDYHAVQMFTTMALEHLREQRGLEVQNIIQWTDGCSAQYKSKGPFNDISQALEKFDATLVRNFYGSRHGKGPSDGESAVIKQYTARAVRAGTAMVASAEDMFTFLQASSLNLQPPVEGCEHNLRSFFWVADGTIDRERPGVKTVKGTRSFHSVKCIENGQIHCRHLSCACDSCLSGTGECPHTDVTGPWNQEGLRPPGRQPQRGQLHQAQPRRRRRRALAFPDPPSPPSQPDSPAAHDAQPDSPPGRQPQRGRQLRQAQPRGRTRRALLFPDRSSAAAHEAQPGSSAAHDAQPGSLAVHDAQPGSSAVHDTQPGSPAVHDAQPDSPPGSPAVHDAQPGSALLLTTPEMHSDEPFIGAGEADNVPGSFGVPSSPCSSTGSTEFPALAAMAAPLSPSQLPSSEPAVGTDILATPQMISSRNLKKGDYVKVAFSVRNGGTKEYVGKVLEADLQEVEVTCLRNRGKYYTFPQREDRTWVDYRQIVAKLGHPTITGRDQYIFDL